MRSQRQARETHDYEAKNERDPTFHEDNISHLIRTQVQNQIEQIKTPLHALSEKPRQFCYTTVLVLHTISYTTKTLPKFGDRCLLYTTDPDPIHGYTPLTISVLGRQKEMTNDTNKGQAKQTYEKLLSISCWRYT